MEYYKDLKIVIDEKRDSSEFRYDCDNHIITLFLKSDSKSELNRGLAAIKNSGFKKI